MLSYLKLNNFRSFSQIMLDLRGPKKIPKKLAFVYGENGAGKSNLIASLQFLSQTFETMRRPKYLEENEAVVSGIAGVLPDRIKSDVLKKFLALNAYTLEELIQQNQSLQNTEPMSIEIGFYLNEKEGSYSISFRNNKVVYEEIKYLVGERVGKVFSISEDEIFFSPSVFVDMKYIIDLKETIKMFWGKHTFVAILFNELSSKNSKYVKSKINSSLLDVLSWFRDLSILCKDNRNHVSQVAISYEFLSQLEGGKIKAKDNLELKTFENALNSFFTSLYADVKKVYYDVKTVDNEEYEYNLYFRKQINGRLVDVPFTRESTGTQKLLNVFPLFFAAIDGTSVFVDEVDSGIHDLLMCELVKDLEESLKGQFIGTTHNTQMMRSLKRENVYIIRSDVNGNKEIVCIDDYEFRTQRNNNLQKKYLDGDYEGIPFVGYFDFDEIVSDVNAQLDSHNLESKILD
ncbi:AAA family ATPase [Scatolibacter rhodanostii]|uniref:AAA family ATPase n=1 Tax=Scatolibacter rhodanostii TaxID=2014781 RepID=UPI000C075C5E|nr:ATP-binding protein [Scatolibacter rhodanostii]